MESIKVIEELKECPFLIGFSGSLRVYWSIRGCVGGVQVNGLVH